MQLELMQLESSSYITTQCNNLLAKKRLSEAHAPL
jgi:hypothetical protein